MILYHGSKWIVESPEIRIQNIIKIFILDFTVHYYRNRQYVGRLVLMEQGI